MLILNQVIKLETINFDRVRTEDAQSGTEYHCVELRAEIMNCGAKPGGRWSSFISKVSTTVDITRWVQWLPKFAYSSGYLYI